MESIFIILALIAHWFGCVIAYVVVHKFIEWQERANRLTAESWSESDGMEVVLFCFLWEVWLVVAVILLPFWLVRRIFGK